MSFSDKNDGAARPTQDVSIDRTGEAPFPGEEVCKDCRKEDFPTGAIGGCDIEFAKKAYAKLTEKRGEGTAISFAIIKDGADRRLSLSRRS